MDILFFRIDLCRIDPSLILNFKTGMNNIACTKNIPPKTEQAVSNE